MLSQRPPEKHATRIRPRLAASRPAAAGPAAVIAASRPRPIIALGPAAAGASPPGIRSRRSPESRSLTRPPEKHATRIPPRLAASRSTIALPAAAAGASPAAIRPRSRRSPGSSMMLSQRPPEKHATRIRPKLIAERDDQMRLAASRPRPIIAHPPFPGQPQAPQPQGARRSRKARVNRPRQKTRMELAVVHRRRQDDGAQQQQQQQQRSCGRGSRRSSAFRCKRRCRASRRGRLSIAARHNGGRATAVPPHPIDGMRSDAARGKDA